MNHALTLFFPHVKHLHYLHGANEIVVGRSVVCNLRLENFMPLSQMTLISRRHFKLTFIMNEGFLIEDLSSRNGTRLNGNSLIPGAPVFIKSGDIIQLAESDDCIIEVREESGSRTEPLELPPVASTLSGILYRSLEGEFILDGQVISHTVLTTLEYRLLDYLYDNAGRVCSYSELVQNVWGYSDAILSQSNTVSKTISNVRRKLEDMVPGAGRRHIHTAHGRGVKLVPI